MKTRGKFCMYSVQIIIFFPNVLNLWSAKHMPVECQIQRINDSHFSLSRAYIFECVLI